jgi:hypothetical protein
MSMKISDAKRLKKIKDILNKANKNFKPVKMVRTKKGVFVDTSNRKKDQKRLEHNFIVYAKALESIGYLIDKVKETKVQCPYCKVKYTTILKEDDKRRSFWCEVCEKPK